MMMTRKKAMWKKNVQYTCKSSFGNKTKQNKKKPNNKNRKKNENDNQKNRME